MNVQLMVASVLLVAAITGVVRWQQKLARTKRRATPSASQADQTRQLGNEIAAGKSREAPDGAAPLSVAGQNRPDFVILQSRPTRIKDF
jgi:Tfp pilus assembly protein PilV